MVDVKITYVLNGNTKVVTLTARSKNEALVYFYQHYPCDDVVKVDVQ